MHFAAENREIGTHPLGAQRAVRVDIGVGGHGARRAHCSNSAAGASLRRAATADSAALRSGAGPTAPIASLRNAHLSSERAAARGETAREQIEQQVLVQPAGGRAVGGLDVVGVDRQARSQIDFRAFAVDQSAQRLQHARARRAGGHLHVGAAGHVRLLAGDPAKQQVAAGARCRVKYRVQGVRVLRVLGRRPGPAYRPRRRGPGAGPRRCCACSRRRRRGGATGSRPARQAAPTPFRRAGRGRAPVAGGCARVARPRPAAAAGCCSPGRWDRHRRGRGRCRSGVRPVPAGRPSRAAPSALSSSRSRPPRSRTAPPAPAFRSPAAPAVAG